MAKQTLVTSGHKLTLGTWKWAHDTLGDCVELESIECPEAREDFPGFVKALGIQLTTLEEALKVEDPLCGVDDVVIDLPVDIRYEHEIDRVVTFIKDSREEYSMDFEFTTRLLLQKEGEKTPGDLHIAMRKESAAREAGFTAPTAT